MGTQFIVNTFMKFGYTQFIVHAFRNLGTQFIVHTFRTFGYTQFKVVHFKNIWVHSSKLYIFRTYGYTVQSCTFSQQFIELFHGAIKT